MSIATNTVSEDAGQPDSAAELVRPLGAFERMYHRYIEVSPMHFLIAAEFARPLAEREVAAALSAVQKRHPLLSVHVEDRPESRLGFYRAATVPAIPLTVVRQDAGSWQQVAEQELSRRMDAAEAPMIRAALVVDAASSVLLLTFNHIIADGMSGVFILQDILAVLNGRQLESLPVPPSQEELIAGKLPSLAELGFTEFPAGDERMAVPGVARPFEKAAPHVSTLTLDPELTGKIVERCRAEGTTVHALLVTVASRVRSALTGAEFVRVVSPFNIRSLIGVGGDVTDYISSLRTGSTPLDGTALWDQARALGAELKALRSAVVVVAGSAMIQQFVPADADSATAMGFMDAASAYELLMSNLGVLDIEQSGPIHPTAVWGPIMLCQVEGEEIAGITTFEGRLRIVTAGHNPTEQFLADVRKALTEAVS